MTRDPDHPLAAAPTTLSCRHFGACGGCSLLDQPIRWQLHDKVEACERILAPLLGGVRVANAPPDRPPQHFRTRLLYPVRSDRDGRPITGMYEYRSHRVVRIEQCRTQDPWLTDLGRAAERVLRELRLEVWSRRQSRGMVKAVWARLASGSGEVLAGIVTQPGAFPGGSTFAAGLQRAAAEIPRGRDARRLVGVVHSISERDDEFLLGDRHVPLQGRDHIVDRCAGLTFRISAGSFYQIHAAADALLYRPALALLGSVRGMTAVDGYGGVGCFGLRLARAGAAQVTIVEDNPAACRDAAHNIAANGIENARVVASPFAGARMPKSPDLLVVDPPRAGLATNGVRRVLVLAPQRVLYIACNARSLAKDLAPLTAAGYRVAAVRLCDLFPHTEHVELAALLQRQ